ncbi:hypothetical protein LTR22_000088 [Elasticomyces elasticus]|nr:hypothetical protein LTR22_000088 [Elasticomyces elasticus]
MVPIRAAEQQALEDLAKKDRQNQLTSLPSRVDQQAADLITWANGHETLTTFACSESLVIGVLGITVQVNETLITAMSQMMTFMYRNLNAMVRSKDSTEVVQIKVQDVLLKGVLPPNPFADCNSYEGHVKTVLKSQTASIERKYQVNWEQSFYTSMICAGSGATEINAAAHADRLSDFCEKVLPKTIGASHMNAHMRMWNFLTKARENGWIHLIMLKQPLFDTYIQRKGAQHTDEEYAAWDGVLEMLYTRFNQRVVDESLGDHRGTADVPSDLFNSPRRDNWNKLAGRWASVEDARAYAAVACVPPLRMSSFDSQAIYRYGYLGHQVLNAARFSPASPWTRRSCPSSSILTPAVDDHELVTRQAEATTVSRKLVLPGKDTQMSSFNCFTAPEFWDAIIQYIGLAGRKALAASSPVMYRTVNNYVGAVLPGRTNRSAPPELASQTLVAGAVQYVPGRQPSAYARVDTLDSVSEGRERTWKTYLHDLRATRHLKERVGHFHAQ